MRAAEASNDAISKQVSLAVAALLAGVSLQDALRRLCDARLLVDDAHRTSPSGLEAALYQASTRSEIISRAEHDRITAWEATRTKAADARFSDITDAEVASMVLGVRSFIERHLS